MHLNASWKGEIQPVLPSDNLQIHLIWLIFASILIISKTTLAEVLLSTCPVSEHRLQYSARNQSFIVFREGFLLTLLLWPWDWADAMLFGFEQGLGTESWRVGVQGAAASKAKFPVSFWVLHSQVVLMHSLSMLHEGLCPPESSGNLNLVLGDDISACPGWTQVSCFFYLYQDHLKLSCHSLFHIWRAPTNVIFPAD